MKRDCQLPANYRALLTDVIPYPNRATLGGFVGQPGANPTLLKYRVPYRAAELLAWLDSLFDASQELGASGGINQTVGSAPASHGWASAQLLAEDALSASECAAEMQVHRRRLMRLFMHPRELDEQIVGTGCAGSRYEENGADDWVPSSLPTEPTGTGWAEIEFLSPAEHQPRGPAGGIALRTRSGMVGVKPYTLLLQCPCGYEFGSVR